MVSTSGTPITVRSISPNTAPARLMRQRDLVDCAVRGMERLRPPA
jgi:hypothetical protein